MGVLESILDYKFLMEICESVGEYRNYEELLEEVRRGYRKHGIIFVNRIEGNKYYNGIQEISRLEAIIGIMIKKGVHVSIERYLEEK